MSKTLIVPTLLAALTLSCTSVQTSTKGTLLVHPREGTAPKELSVEVLESHSITGLAVLCAVTGIFYGGACWAYLATPFAGDEQAALRGAQDVVARLGRCAELIDARVERESWANEPTKTTIVGAGGKPLRPEELALLCASP